MFTRLISLCLSVILFSAVPAMAIDTTAKQALLVDADTGTVLYDKDGEKRMAPSSMSKLMTLYATFKRLKEGRLKLTDSLPISEKAWKIEGSEMFLEVGKTVTIEELLRGIIVQSGNDACVVIAEGLSGTEDDFALELNNLAKEIGLQGSHFMNATGLPDPEHYMTPRDLYILAVRLIHDFPEYYHYFSEREFTYNNITQPNRNLLLNNDLGVDGLKTGHAQEAGYGITITAKDKTGRRLILVINGTDSMKARALEAEKLLRYGFREYENVALVKKGGVVENADVWMGQKSSVPLVVKDDLIVTVPHGKRDVAKFTVMYTGPLISPVKEGAHVADLKVTLPDNAPVTLPLYAGENVEKLGHFARVLPTLSYYIFGSRS